MKVVLLLTYLVAVVPGIKYYSFRPSKTTSVISSATLTNSPVSELPDIFVLCTSHMEERLEGNGYFQMYGEDGRPWLSMSLKEQGNTGSVNLWAYLGAGTKTKSYILGQIPQARPKMWYHICVSVDTHNGTLEAAVNGNRLTQEINTKKESLLTNKPNRLLNRFAIGISLDMGPHKELQLYGSVSNIQVFSQDPGQDLTRLSGSPCATTGDLLTWEDMEWNTTGDGVSEGESGYTVCHAHEANDTLLAIPFGMEQEEAIRVCQKLRGSLYQVPESSIWGGQTFTLSNFTEWFDRTTSGSCEMIWTPISDEKEEGIFVNLEDSKEAKYLPWYDGQPNGGTLENSVVIWPNVGANPYVDVSFDTAACSLCYLRVDLTLSLRGVCKHTLMGE